MGVITNYELRISHDYILMTHFSFLNSDFFFLDSGLFSVIPVYPPACPVGREIHLSYGRDAGREPKSSPLWSV
jgi:hypothetical protein